MIRCDEPMRKSKEQARSWEVYGIPKWRCTRDCERCICGMKLDRHSGAWEHNNTQHMENKK